MTRCFFDGQGACDGQLVRAHLLPRQLIRRTFPHGAVLEDGRWRRLGRYEDRYDLRFRSQRELVDDERSWVPCCGGIVGNGGHHGQLDCSRKVRIPRYRLPVAFVEYAEELGLGWFVDREYGPAERAA